MTEEEWRPIPGYKGLYEVSDRGRVRGVDRIITCSDGRRRPLRGCLLKVQVNPRHGRRQVTLSRNNRLLTHRVATLVMLAFVGPRPDGLEVCHGDGDRTNDALANLRYDTTSNNHLDKVRHGTHNHASKTHCKHGHELTEENIYVPPSKPRSRDCLTCRRENDRLRNLRRKSA